MHLTVLAIAQLHCWSKLYHYMGLYCWSKCCSWWSACSCQSL